MPAVSYDCNPQAAFPPATAGKQRVGYITDFSGLGLTAPLAKDLSVFVPLPATGAYEPLNITLNGAKVVGVIERIEWGGDVTSALHAICYLSQENAALLRGKINTATINALGFCVLNFDPVREVWFEEFYPQTPATIAAAVDHSDGDINVDLTTSMSPIEGKETSFVKVDFQVVPQVGGVQTTFLLADSSTQKIVKAWGIAGGGASPGPVPPPTDPPEEVAPPGPATSSPATSTAAPSTDPAEPPSSSPPESPTSAPAMNAPGASTTGAPASGSPASSPGTITVSPTPNLIPPNPPTGTTTLDSSGALADSF